MTGENEVSITRGYTISAPTLYYLSVHMAYYLTHHSIAELPRHLLHLSLSYSSQSSKFGRNELLSLPPRLTSFSLTAFCGIEDGICLPALLPRNLKVLKIFGPQINGNEWKYFPPDLEELTCHASYLSLHNLLVGPPKLRICNVQTSSHFSTLKNKQIEMLQRQYVPFFKLYQESATLNDILQ